MIETIENKIKELYLRCIEQPNKVLEVFNAYFGENNVDIQGIPTFEEFKEEIKYRTISAYFNNCPTAIANEYIHELVNLPKDTMNSVLEGLTSNEVVHRVGSVWFDNSFLLVYFPKVTITNENNKFVDIEHLYAKVKIGYNGTLKNYFSLNRSEYSLLHIKNSYMHSHVSYIPTSDFTQFQIPCTGSGPINSTMSNLMREFDSYIWYLFCLELHKFVGVESLSGVPYHRLESLTSNNSEDMSGFTVHPTMGYFPTLPYIKIKEFTRYFISRKKLKYNYVNGSFSIGMPFIDYMLLVSNEFINWYNNQFREGNMTVAYHDLLRDKVLKKYIILNNRMYHASASSSIDYERYSSYNGKFMCKFKGKDITINITDFNEVKDENKFTILNDRLALHILSVIIKVINYNYGKIETRDSEGNRINQEVRYI